MEAVTNVLVSLSDHLSTSASAAGPWVVAVRIGPDAHVAGLDWGDGSIVTTDQGLPVLKSFSVIAAGREPILAHLALHDAVSNLILLRTDRPRRTMPPVRGLEPALGSLAIVVGAEFDGAPTMRLAAIHRPARHTGEGAILDVAEGRVQPGALVFDPHGALLGITRTEDDGATSIVAFWAIARLVDNATHGVLPAPAPTPLPTPLPTLAPTQAPAAATIQASSPAPLPQRRGRRGWFGVALQPITVPDGLVQMVGQTSGRLVVGVTAAGPADAAGLQVGDVLLSLDGHSTSGPNSLRAFLENAEVGARVAVRVLRDSTIVTGWLTVGEQP